MAGKAKARSQIKQLLRLHKQGDSIKATVILSSAFICTSNCWRAGQE